MGYDNKVRIIGGKIKGRRLNVLDKEGLRPTIDRVRETVFNWIGRDIEDANVLDLFAGTGALGLEALSRGAKRVVLVEKDSANANMLKSVGSNLPRELAQQVQVVCMDALNYLEQVKKKQDHIFDVVFLDPPFNSDLLERAVEKLVTLELVDENSIIYVEMGKAKRKSLFGLEMEREEVVGITHFGLYKLSSFL